MLPASTIELRPRFNDDSFAYDSASSVVNGDTLTMVYARQPRPGETGETTFVLAKMFGNALRVPTTDSDGGGLYVDMTVADAKGQFGVTDSCVFNGVAVADEDTVRFHTSDATGLQVA